LAKKEAMLKYFDYSLVERETYGSLYIPSTHIQGASVWLKPVSKDSEQKTKKKRFLSGYLGQSALDSYLSIFDFMESGSNRPGFARILVPINCWAKTVFSK
jgi:hypothetical protein